MYDNYPPGVTGNEDYFWGSESECPTECQECGAELEEEPDYGGDALCQECGESTHWATDEELKEWAEEDAADRAYDMAREDEIGRR